MVHLKGYFFLIIIFFIVFLESTDCGPQDFKCGTGACISIDMYCDGVPHCRDGSDEANCTSPCDPKTQLECGDGNCFSIMNKCDKFNDCENGFDEENCNYNISCPPDFFNCFRDICIPMVSAMFRLFVSSDAKCNK